MKGLWIAMTSVLVWLKHACDRGCSARRLLADACAVVDEEASDFPGGVGVRGGVHG